MMNELFYFLVFPGFIFVSIVGGFLSWFDRKITARVQFRQGPPLLQPMYDVVKLLAKETILPEKGSKLTFLAAPVFALFGAVISGVLILLPTFGISTGFGGDIICIIYLLNFPSIAYIFGATASGSPLANVGASREMKLILSYELPFLLVLASIIIKSGMSIKLSEIVTFQAINGAFIGSLSGVLGFAVALMCIQAKLALVPFDMPEAEGEICDGISIEYSGTPYAMIILTKYIMLFILPAFVVSILMSGMSFVGMNILWSILKLILVVLLVTLIRNTNPRVRIDQAMRFFWVWMNILALASIVLAYFGL